jgi:hypothetical protein
MTTNRKPQGVLWVCVGCLFAREGDAPDDPCGHEPEHVPWQREPATDVTYGLDCGIPDHWETDPDAHSEQCETRDFVRSSCDGCGCPLAGTRHAYTWWE